MDLIGLGLKRICPDGIRWGGIGDRAHSRLSLGWAVVCWIGSFGVLMSGVEEGGREHIGGRVGDAL